MKKLFLTSLAGLAFACSAVAATTPVTTTPAAQPAKPVAAAPAKKPADTTVNLYESPAANAKIIATLPVNSDLVTIYHQGDWVEVGDRANGKTGWINLKQYHQAQNNFYNHYFHDNVQSVYVQTSKDKNGKTVVEVYRNGKKLSDAEAQKFYAQMQAQQKKQQEAMIRFNQLMDQQMRLQYLDARRAMDDAFAQPVMMPGVVIIEQPAAKQSEATSQKK